MPFKERYRDIQGYGGTQGDAGFRVPGFRGLGGSGFKVLGFGSPLQSALFKGIPYKGSQNVWG